MSNTLGRNPPLHGIGSPALTQGMQVKITLHVESIRHMSGTDSVFISGGNSQHFSGHHEVILYGHNTVFTPELVKLMMKKHVQVSMIVMSHTQGANGIDASEIIGNVQSIISIEDGDDYK